ncbi:hypothetical protein KZY66_05385 [Prevotella salivae]|jgi:sterol-regulatory element binding protein site 2 protease|uniref:hypothetical protein n=1 Tax=Segatella salivae TaxID=228604 RepID=UPI001C5D30C8|nr:hypothetical protein [Segatella salivae]MBW4906726.1 hypothetical protein [Segatella salivae]
MENILRNYDYHIIQRQKDEYILCYQEEYYQVGSLVYLILLYGKKSNSLEEIISHLHRDDLTIAKLKNIIDASIIPTFHVDETSKKKNEESKKNYWCRYEIASTGKIHWLITWLKPLFGQPFSYILGLSIFLNIILYAFLPKVSLDSRTYNIIVDIVAVYVIYLMILFFHEFGHIAAALKAGLKERCVNFAMYYVFPVLYVKLDDTWTIDLKSRTKINLAGIMIQLLLNLPILGLILIFKGNQVLTQILYISFLMNIATIVFNLIPFMKFDGYWILSDLLNIPNLIQESNNWLKSFFVKPSPFASKRIEVQGFKKFIFVIYCLCKPLFIIMLSLWGIIFITYISFHSFYVVSNLNYMEMNVETLYSLIPDLCLIALAITAGVRYSRLYFKYKKTKKQTL